jgi:hypothetical protein
MNIIRFPPYVDLRKAERMASPAATYRVKKRANRVRLFFNKIRKQVGV